MKLAGECYDCLTRLINQAVAMASCDDDVRVRAVKECTHILDTHFSGECVSIFIATKMHAAIKAITGNPDPYRRMKDIEINTSRELYEELRHVHNDGFYGLLKLAALGNAIDFFRPIEQVKEDMKKDITFTVDMSAEFEKRIKAASTVMYLADNAGEVYFDLPLVQWMQQFASVAYVVKGAPVQNDITIDDINKSGLAGAFKHVITTGTATPGIIFDLASDEFKRKYEAADIIFAKGMGYYESLSEMPADGRILYCLKAKCQPVSNALNVPLHSYVTMIQ